MHVFWSCAFCVEAQDDGAAFAVRVAPFAVAIVGEVFGDVDGVQGDEAETVGDEFVGQDGGVGGDFDKVDGKGGDLGEHHASEGVGEGQ